ncbi:MAG TPA: hypothetical protein VGW10_17025, partial [Solirubrobacteraceae bacterium]|nr:hypothetical protein [Solirubrobacteraceae bacterium]
AGAPPTASATHHPAHVCAIIDFSGGERCMPDPLNPDDVHVGDDVCLGGEIVNGCWGETAARIVTVTCVDLLTGQACPYNDAREATGEPELPGAPSINVQSLLSVPAKLDCVATETVMGREGSGGTGIGCGRSSGSRGHNHFNCAPMAPKSWCISHERHSYHYGTSAWEGDHGRSSVFTCVKFIRDSNGDMIARACANNWVELSVGSSPLKKPLVYNGDDYQRNIYGYARF